MVLQTKKFNQGSLLYRGSSKNVNNSNNISYFIYDKNTPNYSVDKIKDLYVKYQGNRIYQYKTKRPLNLVKMNNKQTVSDLGKTTENENIKNAIEETFRLNNSNNVKRNSNKNRNAVVARHICQLGYDGYIADEMKKGSLGKSLFHREIVLCKPREKINYIGNFSPGVSLMPRPVPRKRPPQPQSPPGTPPSNRQLTSANFSTPSPPKRKFVNKNFSTPSPNRPLTNNNSSTPSHPVMRTLF